MVDKVSNKILYFLVNNSSIDEEKKEILLFGITRIVEDIPKTLGIILIGYFLNILYEMAVVTIILVIYKTFVGGVHAKTNVACFIYSVLFYLAIIYASQYIITSGHLRFLTVILNYIFALYCIWVYVPADVPEIPKIDLNLRRSLKIKAFIVLNIMYIVSYFLIQDIYLQRLIAYSIFFINLMTTRLMYKLFRNEYGHEVYIPYE